MKSAYLFRSTFFSLLLIQLAVSSCALKPDHHHFLTVKSLCEKAPAADRAIPEWLSGGFEGTVPTPKDGLKKASFRIAKVQDSGAVSIIGNAVRHLNLANVCRIQGRVILEWKPKSDYPGFFFMQVADKDRDLLNGWDEKIAMSSIQLADGIYISDATVQRSHLERQGILHSVSKIDQEDMLVIQNENLSNERLFDRIHFRTSVQGAMFFSRNSK